MKKIKTFDDACKALKIKPGTLPDVSAMPEKYRKAMIANYKLMIITEALNKGWEPDWTNSAETKYYPWFFNYKPGVGFSDSGYDGWCAFTRCGSRLCFKSSELATYAGTQFIEIYNQIFIIK